MLYIISESCGTLQGMKGKISIYENFSNSTNAPFYYFRILWHPTGDEERVLGLSEDRIIIYDLNVASSTTNVSTTFFSQFCY